MKRVLLLPLLFLILSNLTGEKFLRGEKKWAGFCGVPLSQFPMAKELGANTVIPPFLPGEEFPVAVEKAKSLGLYLIGRAPGKSRFQREKRINWQRLNLLLEEILPSPDLASHPHLAGYYFIDEPCHPGKWSLSEEDLEKFYFTVKSFYPSLKIMINFGTLECAEKFFREKRVADIISFTITPWKERKDPCYLEKEKRVAERIRRYQPQIYILPLISVYEYPAHGERIPPPGWIQKIGKSLDRQVFQGVIFYSWSPSPYMGKTIQDIADDPSYREAFQKVFALFK